MIGVVGPDEETERLIDVVEDSDVLAGAPNDILAAEPDIVVAIGASALTALVTQAVDVPVLPVEADGGLDSVPLDRAPAIIERGVDRGFDVRRWPLLDVAVGGERVGRGVFDAMLVTTEPARISEYTVETPGESDRFRADGVAVATPAGSLGYARSVRGPVLDPNVGGLAVVPVAEFDVRSTVRVTSADVTVSMRVERNEGGISLLVDGDEYGAVPPGQPVTVRIEGSISTVTSPAE